MNHTSPIQGIPYDSVAKQNALVDGLLGLDETPYGDLNRGRAITTNWLARQLKGVVTQPTKTMQVGEDRKKGYTRGAFSDAWERYGIAGVD